MSHLACSIGRLINIGRTVLGDWEGARSSASLPRSPTPRALYYPSACYAGSVQSVGLGTNVLKSGWYVSVFWFSGTLGAIRFPCAVSGLGQRLYGDPLIGLRPTTSADNFGLRPSNHKRARREKPLALRTAQGGSLVVVVVFAEALEANFAVSLTCRVPLNTKLFIIFYSQTLCCIN